MAHKIRKILFLFILILCITPTVSASDYVFNGETLPATSSYEDTYYGVETMKNILDDLGYSYDDNTLLGYTHYANQFLNYYINNINNSTTALNVCFLKNSSGLVALPSNGGFNETLDYIYYKPYFDGELKGASAFYGFASWNYNSENSIIGVNTKSMKFAEIRSYNYTLYDSARVTAEGSDENYQTSSQLYFKNTLAPSNAFMITGQTPDTGYGYYYLTNQIRFTEEPEPEPEIIPDTIDSTYGYLWSPSVNGDVEINLDYKEQNQLIHGEHFIGSSLQSTFVFYYYSGDDIVSFNDYVTRNAYLETNYGTWYDFYVSPENLEYLPNNTNFYLNIYATLGQNTATVVKDFLAFHTVDNSSGGDTSGDVPDTDIQNSLNNIENKIPSSGDIQNIVSQETDKIINFMSGDADFKNENISSGDIIGSIGYEPPDDPYANFWWELTEILNNALTGTNRTLTLKAIKNTYTISIDDIGWNPPDVLRTFLTLLSTTVVCWVLIKYIKITIDKLSSGSIDEALAMNEECGIVDLF